MIKRTAVPALLLILACSVVVLPSVARAHRGRGLSPAAAAAVPSPVVPGNALVAGRGYGQWVTAAWRWRLSLPRVTLNTTSCLTPSQHGPVWFLAGSYFKGVRTLSCAVPTGRYLMLYTPSIYCSTVQPPPFHATTNAGLARCAQAYWRKHPGGEVVTLDGVNLNPFGARGGTGVFEFKMPPSNNYLRLPGRTRGRMAVYGIATILRPLSPGTHALVQSDWYANTSSYKKTVYELTVG